MTMPTIRTYGHYAGGNYSGRNYGTHALVVELGGVTVWFSYQTPVAFRVQDGKRVVRQNDWSTTTGKHLNWIDGGDKASRVTGEEFERLYREHVENRKM